MLHIIFDSKKLALLGLSLLLLSNAGCSLWQTEKPAPYDLRKYREKTTGEYVPKQQPIFNDRSTSPVMPKQP